MNLQESILRVKRLMNLNEGLDDTSWENEDGDKMTLHDLLKLSQDIPVVDYPMKELKSHLLTWDEDEKEVKKIEKANLKYPILIFVDNEDNFVSLIDGHHRAQKALMKGHEFINAKLININQLPKEAKKVFKYLMNEGTDKHGWGSSKKKLTKNFEFKDFNEAMKFVNKIAKIADKQNHHPDITIKYNKVNITITDHDKGGVSDKCMKFVLKVNELK